jgi:long-chain acyl-CoA synthetase
MAQLLEPLSQVLGDELALADERGTTSWVEFNERVNRLMSALTSAGLTKTDTLAILSENRREYYECMAAATHLGLRYVPVNWHWVAEEVSYVLENSDSNALLVSDRFAGLAAEALAQPDCPPLKIAAAMGEDPPAPFLGYEALLAESSPEESPATGLGGPMFYTSGTTGRPKGVVSGAFSGDDKPIELMMFVGKSIVGNLGMPEVGRTLLVGPVYHSAQWAFSFLPLLAGNAVVMRHGFSAEETLDLIDGYAITNIHLVPTQFVRLLRVEEKRRKSFDGSSLQAVWHGAAPCSPHTKRAMIDWWGERISEYYGSTESAIISTISSQEWLARPGSLGKPLPNLEVRVIKEDGSTADTGESGQLYFRNQMGTDFEYHKDPEKTEAAHLEPGVFSVGDIGYLDEDGYLYMSDRKIDMIISGGVNIYPAEIEGVLVSHSAVADAAVFGIPNEEFGEEVKAAVELLPGFAASERLAEEIKTHCRDHLAGYKTPRSVDFEEKLPRHPTGKLYKRILRDRYWEGLDRKI